MTPDEQIVNTTGNFAPGRDIVLTLGVAMGVASVRYVDYSENVAREARLSALARMNEHAKQMSADAVIGIRFDSVLAVTRHSYSDDQTLEYTAYGTAVVTVSRHCLTRHENPNDSAATSN